MRFEVLGPLRVSGDSGEIAIRGRKRQLLLVNLLCVANRPVSTDALVEEVWGGGPGEAPAKTLRWHVHQLRQQLGDGGRIVLGNAGYSLRLAPEESDALRFEALLGRASAARRRGETEVARGLLGEALGLWRGRAYEDLAELGAVRQEAHRLEQLRLHAQELWCETELESGQHAELVSQLSVLVETHPLRERFRSQLMLALYRCGRRAEALAVYREGRDVLSEQLGLDPSRQLRELEKAILAADPSLDHTGAEVRVAPPRQLPPDVADFVGRAGLLRDLDELSHGAATAVLSTVTGTGGVGKTALAIRWGHLAAERYPDGQLYVDLAGFGPSRQREVSEVLAFLLRGLGVSPDEVPPLPDDRLARYRSEVADKRLLLILDNAAGPDQVRPLLPTGRGSFTVVTTRHAFTGMLARDGAKRLYVDRLAADEALELVGRLIGERVAAEPAAARSFVELCARLPLALRVGAQRAVDEPDVPLADIVSRLRAHGLDFVSDAEDSLSDTRAVFSWSLRRLPESARRMFTLWGVHPGEHLDAPAAAALADVDTPEAATLLETLAEAHLVHHIGPDRYGTHDLLRAYAVELAADAEPEAWNRLCDYYVHSLVAAQSVEHPWDREQDMDFPGAADHARRFDGEAAAASWLDAELDNLVALTERFAATGRYRYALSVSTLLWRRLNLRARHDEALTIHREAYQAAVAGDDGRACGATSFRVADTWWRIGAYTDAETWFKLSRDHMEHVGDDKGVSHAVGGLGAVYLLTGRLDEAEDCYRVCLRLAREQCDADTECITLNNLGELLRDRGDHAAAFALYSRGRELADLHDFKETRLQIRIGLGSVLIGLERFAEAEAELSLAVTDARRLGADNALAEALTYRGQLAAILGDDTAAANWLRDALHLFERTQFAFGRELVTGVAAKAGITL